MEKAGTNEDMAVFVNARTPKTEYTITLPVVICGFMKERHMSKKHLLMDSEGDYNIK